MNDFQRENGRNSSGTTTKCARGRSAGGGVHVQA